MRRRAVSPRATVLVVVAAAVWPPSAKSQAVVGEVVDDTRAAVVGAAVGVFDARGRLVAQSTSDGSGRFRVEVPESGRHRLHVTGLGYRSVTGGPYDLRAGLELEVFVVLHPAPIPLDGVDVEVARSGRLEIAGFYEREAAGFGYHFEREELESRGSIDVSEFLIQRVPGLNRSTRGVRLFGAASMRNDRITLERGPQGCVPALWVDGVLSLDGGRYSEPLRPDDWFTLGEIEGIEFYGTASGAPIEFASSANCGVLVVWTRGSGLQRAPGVR